MQRTCPKCGHVNEHASPAADATCPQCGVIYAKAAVSVARQRQVESIRERMDAGVSAGSPARNKSPTPGERFMWVFSFLCGVLGLFELGYTMLKAESAPQQGAGAAMAMALAVIPYCLARALQLSNR